MGGRTCGPPPAWGGVTLATGDIETPCTPPTPDPTGGEPKVLGPGVGRTPGLKGMAVWEPPGIWKPVYWGMTPIGRGGVGTPVTDGPPKLIGVGACGNPCTDPTSFPKRTEPESQQVYAKLRRNLPPFAAGRGMAQGIRCPKRSNW